MRFLKFVVEQKLVGRKTGVTSRSCCTFMLVRFLVVTLWIAVWFRGFVIWLRGSWFRHLSGDPKKGVTQKVGWQPRAAE